MRGRGRHRVQGSYRMLRSQFGGQWGVFAAAAASTLFLVIADLARPFPLKLVIDGLLAGGGSAIGGGIADGEVMTLAAIAGLVLCIAGVEAIAAYQMEMSLRRAGESITHSLRVAVYGQLQRLSLSFHEERQHGDLLTRATGDVEAVGRLFSDSLGVLASSALLLVGMVAVSFTIDPVLALVTLAIAPVLALSTLRFRGRVRTVVRRQRAKDGEIASLAAETLSSMREVKALGSERFEYERLERKSQERREAGLEASRIEGRFAGIADVLSAAGAATVLVIGAIRVANGAMTAGDLVVMISYARRIHKPLRDLARQAGKMAKSIAQAERVAEILTTDRVLAERPGAHRGPRARGALELDAVRFAYAPGRRVLDGCSLSVAAGEKVALVGPSGAGKSTVAALLARFYDPDEGSVRLDGHDLRDCSLTWLREQIGLVLQETVLFTGTVAENIAYGVDATREEVIRAASVAGADAFIRELPDGYDTVLGSRGVALSGGQRQRIAIARTLLRDPPVLVLDEPTTALDPRSEAEVLAGLETLIEGRTVLIITHSPTLARWADRTVRLGLGRVLEGPMPAEPPAWTPERDTVRAPRPPVPVPRDDRLPSMSQLLSGEVMTPVLHRTLGEGAPVPKVRVHRLRYQPGRDLVVNYKVKLGGERHQATGMIAAKDYLERYAGRPEHVALAMMVNGRSPAVRPLSYEPELGCLVQWYPLDLSLPILAERPADLVRRLRSIGVEMSAAGGEPTLLAYKPRKRAVCRLGDHVVKYYAKESRFRTAELGLRISQGLGSILVPRPAASLPEWRLTVQSFLPGATRADPQEVAGAAGAVLAALHRAEPDQRSGLRRFSPTRQLEAAAASGALVGSLLPSIRPRLTRLLGRLEETMPAEGRLVMSHGDFSVHQLLEVGPGLALTDFDELCLAPDGLDLASFSAYLVFGRPDDLQAAGRTLDALTEGYGRRPAAMPWYMATMILRRSPRPFRYVEPDWPDLVDGIVTAAEEALAG